MIIREVFEGEPQTLGNFLRLRLKLSTRTRRRLKFRDGGITVNGQHATVRFLLHSGDVVELDCEDRPDRDTGDAGFSEIIPVDLPLRIVYEDEFICVADKPGDMPTHPVHGHLEDTAANALAYRAQLRGDNAFVFRPITRLDRNTSGLILSARDFVSSDRLCRSMQAGEIRKTYIAILRGVPEKLSGTVDAPIDRAGVGTLMRTVTSDGYPSVTDYNILKISGDGKYSLAELHPKTGRTHQIRVHMAHIGCPLLGDFLYGEESQLIARHALHASELEFTHPQSGEHLAFKAPLPADMDACVKTLFGDTQ